MLTVLVFFTLHFIISAPLDFTIIYISLCNTNTPRLAETPRLQCDLEKKITFYNSRMSKFYI